MKINRKIILIMLVFMVLSGTTFYAEEKQNPTYEELFEQQMRIYETKRYIERNQKEQRLLKKELKQLEDDIPQKTEELKESIEEVKPILLKMYGGESMMWAELFLQLENLEDVMTVYHVSKTYTEKEMAMLYELNEELENLSAQETELKDKKKELERLTTKLIEELKRLEKDEALYKSRLGLVDDVEKAKREVEELIQKWETEGLKSLKKLFAVMSRSIENLPNTMDKDTIKAKSLFTYEVTLSDKQLNKLLTKEDNLFNDIQFRFNDGGMQMKGDYEGMTFDAKGYYELIKETELRLHITSLHFEGVKLPEVTSLELEENYDLGLYPSEVVEGAKIKDFNIDDGDFTLEVSF